MSTSRRSNHGHPIALDPKPESGELYVGRARSQRNWGWLSVGAGVVIAGAGTGYLLYNAGAKEDARADRDAAVARLTNMEGVCKQGSAEGDADKCNAAIRDTQNQYNSVKSRDVIGYVGLGVGVVATGIGLFLLITGDNPNKYDKKPTPDVLGSITPRFAVGPGSAAFAVSGVL